MKKITFLMVCLMTMTLANAQLTSVALVGDGAGGWPTGAAGEIDAKQMSSTDNEHWTYDNLAVTIGSIKFRGNNAWTLPYNWGGTAWPNGTATVDGPGISSTPGVYDVTFNSTTGAYTFTLDVTVFPVIGMVGTATPGDWAVDTDMNTTDGINYIKTNMPLTAAAVKFRQDHTWTSTTNWGGDTFPSGIGTVDGAAITVTTAGNYTVTFNRNTRAYSFSFPSIAIVGGGTPGGWPTGAVGEIDPGVLSTTDGVSYTLASITLTSAGVKFRANNSWAQNWGSNTFFSGTGTQDGVDIPAVAGQYSVAFNRLTGVYGFTSLATENFSIHNFKVYPNPSHNSWNFNTVSNEKIQSISIVDVTGKTVFAVAPQTSMTAIDVSALGNGIYFAKISTASATETIKLIKN